MGMVLVHIDLYISAHGMGRATFEGIVKATFADNFAYEKKGAFANIILKKRGLQAQSVSFLEDTYYHKINTWVINDPRKSWGL